MSNDIKSLVKSILTGEIKAESLSIEQFNEVNAVISLIKNRIYKNEILEKPPVSEAQRKAMHAAASGKSNIGIPQSVGKDFTDEDKGGKLPKKILSKAWAPNAQWSLEKAIKPGPTLNYGKINPGSNPISNPESNEVKAGKAAAKDAAAPTIDYGNKPTAKPTYTGAADRAKQVRAQIDTQINEPALDTIARKQKMNKDEGTNVEKEPSASEIGRMTAKSEAEPHDDPEHEKKEKEKAKKIKNEAEDILDMHKKDDEHSIEIRTIDGKQVPVKVYPTGKKPKDLSAKPTRSVDGMYGVNYGKKTGVPVKGTLKNT